MKTRVFFMLMLMSAVLLGCGTLLQAEENHGDDPASDIAATCLQEVKIDGDIYYNTFRESDVELRCGVMDGEITSSVASGMMPMEDDQSNFGTGYAYQRTGFGTVDVLIDGKYMVFQAMYPENRFGVTMEATDVTDTGLKLTITRSDSLSEWEIVTGSAFGLTVLQNGTYEPYYRSDGLMIDVSWTMEAYMVTAREPLVMEVDWAWLYDELPPGTYRFGKSFTASKSTDEGMETEQFDLFVPIFID